MSAGNAQKPRGNFPGAFPVRQLALHEMLFPNPSVVPGAVSEGTPGFSGRPVRGCRREPLFQAVCTRLADGLIRFRVVSAAPIYTLLQSTVRLFEHPSVAATWLGETHQASFPCEGVLTASLSGLLFHDLSTGSSTLCIRIPQSKSQRSILPFDYTIPLPVNFVKLGTAHFSVRLCSADSMCSRRGLRDFQNP